MIRSVLPRALPSTSRSLFFGFSVKKDPSKDQRPELSQFDQQNMQEILKQTKDTDQPFVVQKRTEARPKPGLLKDRPTQLDLKQYRLLKPHEMADDPSLDRPKGIMDFVNPSVTAKTGFTLLTREPACEWHDTDHFQRVWNRYHRERDSLPSATAHVGHCGCRGHPSSSL